MQEPPGGPCGSEEVQCVICGAVELYVTVCVYKDEEKEEGKEEVCVFVCLHTCFCAC